ncbi:MAG TPA: EF-Tu/IF-2/RF-3 family GTPase, partial [Chloroflexota bacterium]|nr:EF-Tu/IF-2/RF-3 family GTPase [Chloroflexota bacterium]
RQNARSAQVLELTQDLFLELATDAEQLNFPVVYTVARQGVAVADPASFDPDVPGDLTLLFETILEHVPPPTVDAEEPFQMLVTSLNYDDYKGKFAIGRISRGKVAVGDTVARVNRHGEVSPFKVANVFTHQGLKRLELTEASAGDIVALTGISDASIGDTIADVNQPEGLPPIAIEEPTVKMTFGVNTSPLSGREGRWSTSRQLRDRLYRELEVNVALRVADTDSPDEFLVSGRGELHLAILIETMRREGYEFQVSRPEVVTRVVDGKVLEPRELLVIDTHEEYVGTLTENLSRRQGRMVNMHNDGNGNVRLEFHIPTRGLIGFRNAFLTSTRGNGVMGSILLGYEPWQGEIRAIRNGALIASESGMAITYGLLNAQERGTTFVEPGTTVYEGMIVGLYTRDQDLVVNVCKEKQKTNVRASTAEIDVRLTPATIFSLEQSIDFINDDEFVEVTPKSIRLRKKLLTINERQRARKDRSLANAMA